MADRIEDGGPAHTPGPWSYRPGAYDDWGIVRAPKGGDGFAPVICQARNPYCLDSDDLAIHRANKTDPWEANARLIAAAPCLLSALEAIVSSLSEQDDEGMIEHAPQMVAARAAISRARQIGLSVGSADHG